MTEVFYLCSALSDPVLCNELHIEDRTCESTFRSYYLPTRHGICRCDLGLIRQPVSYFTPSDSLELTLAICSTTFGRLTREACDESLRRGQKDA
jgi:hypothetical protein